MIVLLSQCLYNPPCYRRALLHNGAVLSANRQTQIKNGKQTERRQFKRDELPHSGRSPAPQRSKRIAPSWSGRGSRHSLPVDRSSSPLRDTSHTNSVDAGRMSSRVAPNRHRSTPGKVAYRREDTFSRPLFVKTSRSDHRATDSRRSEPGTVQRLTSYLSPSPANNSLNSDMPTTFGNVREDRELEEGAYDTPETADEFFHPPEPVTLASSSTRITRSSGKSKSFLDINDTLSSQSLFTSPPLLPGFVSAVKEMFGPNAQPTPIQSLSIAHCLPSKPVDGAPGWKQFLLASETGSGKSIAYLLPLLQGIKTAELAAEATPPSDEQAKVHSQCALNPRGLVLAPTHELARQLAGFAKALLHDVKLRVLCASRANYKSTAKRTDASAAQMAAQFSDTPGAEGGGLQVMKGGVHPVGAVVGTPMKLLEMVRGRGWDRIEEDEANAKAKEEDEEDVDEDGKPRIKPRRGRDKMVHYGTWRAKPELGLANVEWVVVDEADVLFDPDFQETTRTLLADVSAARGHILPASASIPVPPSLGQPTSPSTLSNPLPTFPTSTPSTSTPTSTTAIDYPFNLILTSATIPKSLNAYLTAHHPALVRLASPRLHRLPRTLQTEYVGWTGGNKFADVVRRIRRVWAEDAASGHAASADSKATRTGGLSKILVFCNRSAKVEEFSAYLDSQGVKSVAMTSRSEQRGRGSNRHLEGFLRKRSSSPSSVSTPSSPSVVAIAGPKAHPHVLITTSLLSRGLDFSPDIKHVFIVDEPRNTVDFLHRAGRTGRAGAWGKVVIFGKLKGRGSQRTKEVRKRIQGLRAT